MNRTWFMLFCFAATQLFAESALSQIVPGFHKSANFGELVRDEWMEGSVRVHTNLPAGYDPNLETRLIIYATPNGNTLEQTLGCAMTPGLDWHYDIQHVAAQVRRLRQSRGNYNLVLAVVEAEGLSWPAWRKKHADASARIVRIVEKIRERTPGDVTLTGHSGGGSFITGFIEAADAIPDYVQRIAYLDANYSYSDAAKHGDKLLAWWRRGTPFQRQLCVVAYDDRNITLNGKLVVGPDGGTFRATQRMIARFQKDIDLKEKKVGDFVVHKRLDEQISFWVHTNPQNKILHTALVGEMNGLLHALTIGDPKAPAWGEFGGPRAYTNCVVPAPGIPPRPANAQGGAAFLAAHEKIAKFSPAMLEDYVATEICNGNIPDFLRKFRQVAVSSKDAAGKEHSGTIEVMPDYLAIGSNEDFIRVPMSPQTAQMIADAFGCSLPTRKIVDDVYRQAAVKLAPIPLTEAREAVATFVQHNGLIEKQRAGKELGALVAGIKKDVVVTNRLGEKANRVALYGWHKLDGAAIQPLTIVHVNWYVDYSHAVRLVKRTMTVDGKPRDIRMVLHAADICGLVSDEGPIEHSTY